MIEFVVGLVVGALAFAPSLFVFDRLRSLTAQERDEARDKVDDLLKENHSLHLQLAAPTSVERAGIAALLNRPDPEPEVAGRWIHSDDGLVSSFIPDVG